MNRSNITIGEYISPQLSLDIRENIDGNDYEKVAAICSVSSSYLRMIVGRQRTVTEGNQKAVETLIRLGIQNSQSKRYSRQRLINALDECESEALRKLNEVL